MRRRCLRHMLTTDFIRMRVQQHWIHVQCFIYIVLSCEDHGTVLFTVRSFPVLMASY